MKWMDRSVARPAVGAAFLRGLLLVAALLACAAAEADPALVPAPEAPASGADSARTAKAGACLPHIQDETLPLTLRDDLAAKIILRVPRSLYRDANKYRLWGVRPLTLRARGHRRDLYRDAFLELATQSRLAPAVTAWEPISKQWQWVLAQNPSLKAVKDRLPALPAAPSLPPSVQQGVAATKKYAAQLNRKLSELPGYPQVASLGKAMGWEVLTKGDPEIDLTGPATAALELRALATDAAEQRLIHIGQLLALDAPGADPALRAGYRDARAEFEQLRTGLWPAIGASVSHHQGELLLSAVKGLAFSHLGYWALFGQLAWISGGSALTAEYNGQYAICLSTLTNELAAPLTATADPERVNLELYGEFAVNYQLTEALKDGQVLGLKPAGGKAAGTWQIQFSQRCDELKKALAAG